MRMRLATVAGVSLAAMAWAAPWQLAPLGEPALGPVAFMHRASAGENPTAPLGHHWLDSTHITSNVITAGWGRGRVALEASAFHGREPDEHRWDLDSGPIDSGVHARLRAAALGPAAWRAWLGPWRSRDALKDARVYSIEAWDHVGTVGYRDSGSSPRRPPSSPSARAAAARSRAAPPR